jgi:hypothetical protein
VGKVEGGYKWGGEGAALGRGGKGRPGRGKGKRGGHLGFCGRKETTPQMTSDFASNGHNPFPHPRTEDQLLVIIFSILQHPPSPYMLVVHGRAVPWTKPRWLCQLSRLSPIMTQMETKRSPKAIKPSHHVISKLRPKHPLQRARSTTHEGRQQIIQKEEKTEGMEEHLLPPQPILRSYPLSISIVAAHALG